MTLPLLRSPGLVVALLTAITMVPWAQAAPDVRPETFAYASAPGVDPNLLSLDLYRVSGDISASRPVVVMVHGGGWRLGDKAHGASGAEKAGFFNALGAVYVSVNYRLSPAVRHPVHARDVAAAVAWVFDHIAGHGGDPDKITLLGHSAGAHLAALVGTDERLLAAHGHRPDQLAGVVLLDGAGYDIRRVLTGMPEGPMTALLYRDAFGDDPQTWADASPSTHVQPGEPLPPFLIFHTGRALSTAASREFAGLLRAAGGQAWSLPAVDKTHVSLNRDIGRPDDGPSRTIAEFLAGKRVFPEIP